MKILVIHDRDEAAIAIEKLARELGLEDLRILRAIDGQTGKQRLSEDLYDLVVLDLTLPYILGKTESRISVAEEMLQELFTRDSLHVPGDIVGITRDPEAVEVLSSTIGSHLMAVIREDDDGLWRDQLADRIRYAARARTERQFSVYQHHDIDVLVVTALDEEFDQYASLFELSPLPQYPGAKRFGFKDRIGVVRRGVGFSIGRSGQPRAASRVQSLISVFRPKLVIMSGFCGGYAKKVEAGDLLAFEVVHDWDYGKWETRAAENESQSRVSEFLSRPVPVSIEGSRAIDAVRELMRQQFHLDPRLLRAIREKSEGLLSSTDVKIVQAASGSAVIANADVLEFVRGVNDNIRAVDMESYGLYHAAKYTHVISPEVLCLKAVSDAADISKGDELHSVCSLISARAVDFILRTIWDF